MSLKRSRATSLTAQAVPEHEPEQRVGANIRLRCGQESHHLLFGERRDAVAVILSAVLFARRCHFAINIADAIGAARVSTGFESICYDL